MLWLGATGRIRDGKRTVLSHLVCVTHSVGQELVSRCWFYVPFETNDVDTLCWESVDHPSGSVNHGVRYKRCFRREGRRMQLRLVVLYVTNLDVNVELAKYLCERCGKVSGTE